jgi:putative ABC transport system permease protein
VGKNVYVYGTEPSTVVGVFEHIARPNESGGEGADGYAMILPITFDGGGEYLVRVAPERRAETLAAAVAALDQVDPNRVVIEQQLFTELRAAYFRQDRAMAYLLTGVCVALLVITSLGVVGLASFWVQQRRRQIGIRRALGATRGDILRYFQVENFILATLGIALGMILAYGINLWLMEKYKVARLPAEFLPIGAILLWALGQIAVLGPAVRAASVPPAVATRTV